MLFRRSHRARALAGLAVLSLFAFAACSDGGSSAGSPDADGDAVAADGLGSDVASPDADAAVPDADAAAPDADTSTDLGPDTVGDAPDGDASDGQTDGDAADADTDTTPAGPAMRFLSTPPALAVVGKGWAYEPILDLPGDALLALDAAPEGMVLGDDGRIQWTSTAGGEATVTVSATLGDSTAAQSFVLISASPVPLASASIGAAGGLVKPAGDDPALAGVGISVPAGALSEVREISMATLAGAPAPAALAGAETTTPLLLEPTGTAFATPVRVTLKYPAALDAAAAAGELDAWLMDEATGDWDSAEVVQIDAVERLLTVEVNHFSVLVAGTNGFNLVLDVQDTTEVEGCVRSLTVKPALAQQLTEVPVTTALAKRPNLLTHPWDALADTSLAQLTSDPTSAGTLRVLWVAELLGNSGQVVGIDALAVSLEAFAGGAGRLVVARPDGSAGLIADIADRGADASFASIARGEGLTFRFKPPTPLDADPKLRVRVYFRADDDPAGQAPYLTTHQGAPLTEALGQVAATVALASGDADCDGVLDTIDPNVGTGTPEILQLPAATASVNVGDALNLACAAVGPAGADALTFTWTSTGSGDEFVPTTGSAGAPDGVAFTASTAGVRLVSCATAWQDAPLAAVFAVKVVKVAAPCGGGCDDANPCTKDICDQVSDTCVHAALMGPCEDGDPCTAGDTCGAGACQSGPAPDCDDGNPCTADACDAATGACAHTDQAGACEDGDLCTSGDACVGGVCVAGAPIACDDGKTCTDDQCDPGTGACATTPVSCPDGQLCQAGVGCAASPACTVDGDCAASEDGDACNGTLRCVGGACEIDPATVPAPCAASGDPCLVNVCDPGSGACVAQAAPGSPVCDDGEPCTVGDVCVAGACEPGAADGCDDADPCTIDICAPQTGCGHTAVACAEGESCDSVRGACEPEPECVTTDDCAAVEDGDLCNGTLACVDGECTLDAATVPAPCAQDGDECTVSACEPSTGECVSAAVEGSCDDADPCTTDDACTPGGCQGSPVTCAPDEACDPSDGQCVSVGDGCVVLLECAGACALDETCVNGCKATASVEAVVLFDAAIGCLLTECPTFESNCFDAAEAGVCATAWQACKVDGAACTDASCDDGDPCTADACDPLVGCSHEGVTCDDGDPCTADSCDPVDGCSYASACDDGDPCTDDSCDASGCQHEPVVCAPGSVCVPEAASCVVPKGGLGCASAVACALACANDVDCVNDCNNQAAGAALSAVDSVMGCILVACGDFDSTCAEQALAATCADAYGICSGIFGSCDLDPCDDGDPCTEDLCDGGLGCLYGPVTCADGSACTTATGSCSAVVTSCAETLSGCLSQCLADDNAPWTCHDTCAGLQPPTPALSALTVCLADACPAGAGASCASTALLPGGACADAATTCIAGVPGDIDGDGVLDTVDPCPYDPAPACLDPASTSCKTAFNDCMFACLDDGLDADFCAPACTTSNMSAAAAAGLLAVQSCITGQCAPGAGASCNTTAVTIHCSSKVLDCYAIEAVCDPAECDDGDPCTTNECGEGGGCIFPPLECPDGASCDPGAGGCVAATKPCGDDIYGCYVPCMAQGGESIACQDGCGPNTSPTLGELASCVAEVCPGPVFNCYSSAMGFGGPCADLHNECLHPTDTDDDGLPDNGDPCPYDPTPDCSGPGELSCALLYSCLESCVMAGSTGLSCAGSCPPAETSSEVSGALLDVGFCMQQNCTAFSEPTCVEDLASLDGPCGTQVTACVLPGVDCSAAACDDGDACTDDTCDSIGTCYHKSNGQCGP